MKDILYDWGGFNVWLFHLINNIRGSVWDDVMRLGTDLGDHQKFSLYLVIFSLFILWQFIRSKSVNLNPERLQQYLLVFITFSLAYHLDGYLIGWLKTAFNFPRPPLALPEGSLHVLAESNLQHSFPSGHATFAITVAASIWPLASRAVKVALATFVLWVCLSRISLGVHFPADVIAGCGFGLLVVMAIRYLINPARWVKIVTRH